MKLKPIDQQVVVLMGASSGIGRLAALEFARRGAKVVVSARSEEGLRTLVDEIRQSGGEAIYLVADTAQFEQAKAVADRAVRTYGRLDTWVHLAAVALYATFEQTTPQEFEQVIKITLIGQANGAMAALPHLKHKGGALIHITSVEAVRAFPFHSAYAAAKHGVAGMVEAMRSEFEHAGYPISVTNIMPPSTNTPLFNKARTKIGVKPMPAPPIYQPEAVVDAILHAAEHPVRDIAVGGMGKGITASQRVSPKLVDTLMQGVGFSSQRTDEPKSANAPDNLFGPISGYNRVKGDFSNQSIPHVIPQRGGSGMGAALLGAALGGALLLARKRGESQRR